jgi:haloalkane dehalogenase
MERAPDTILYPFAPHHVSLDGNRLHYIDEGKGEPVVMLHGNPTWSFFYRNLVLGLRDTFRCLALDHMGCGLSDKPQSYDYTLQKHIDNLSRWIDATLPDGERFNLVVHDWGGPIGIGYAARHPERIRRVVVLNTSAFTAGTMPLRIRLCRVPVLGEFLVRGLNAFAGGAAYMTTKTPLAPAVRKGFLLPYDSWANRVAVHKFVMDIPLAPGTATGDVFRETERLLPDALKDKPLLIQWGMRDWCFTPFFLGLWKSCFPVAEADEYDAGHYLLEDAGDVIIPRIRSFLERSLP